MDRQDVKRMMERINRPFRPDEILARRKKIWEIYTSGKVEPWAREMAERQIVGEMYTEAVINMDGEHAELAFRRQDGTIRYDGDSIKIMRMARQDPEYGISAERWKEMLIERNIDAINSIIYQYGVEHPDIID